MTVEIRKAFEAIGARAHVETRGNVFEIDVLQNEDREVWHLAKETGEEALETAIEYEMEKE